MKLDPKFKVFLIIVGVLSILALGYMVYFDADFIPTFPYKYNKITEKSNMVTKLESEVNMLRQKVTNLNNKLSSNKGEEKIPEPTQPNVVEDITKKIPEGIDYASLLLFIEEQSLLNDVVISNLDLKQNNEQNQPQDLPPMDDGMNKNNEDTTSDSSEEDKIKDGEDEEKPKEPEQSEEPEQPEEPLPSEPMTEPNPQSGFGLQQHQINLSIMGDYLKVEKFIESLNEDIGQFNNINSLKIKRGNSQVINWGEFKNDEEKLEEDKKDINKNIIVDIVINLNYK